MKKTALVTGGAIRVGREIALHLASLGYDIALHYNASEKEAAKLASEIKKKKVACEIFPANLGDLNQCYKLIRNVFKWRDNLSVVINSAAIFERFSFMETDEDIFNRHFNINFRAPFFLTREFAKHVSNSKIKNANVINILDTKITRKNHPYFAYILSKKVLAEFTQMAAYELSPKLRVNAVAPGVVIATENFADYVKQLEKKLPLKKIGSTAEINKTISYILDGDYITGECFFVDGGEKLI